jgi:ABC-type multidrug transport system permease subunit
LTGAPHDFRLCLLLNSFLLAVFAVSMFSLLAVSVDRFWAVCYPVTYHVKSTSSTKIIIIFCWIFGILFGFLPVFGWNSGQFDNKCDLRVIADFNYLLVVCVAIAFTSTVIIIVLYALIYRAVLKQVS